MFKGASWCSPILGILYFSQFYPLHYIPLAFPSHSPSFQQLWTHILRSSTFTKVMFLLSLPSFPNFHSVIPLLQTCSTYMFVHDHVFLCICLSFGSIFHIWEKICCLYLSEPDFIHLTWYPPIASIYLQTTWFHSSLGLSKIPLYIFIFIYKI
jgi:hypothetical protein